MSDKFKKHGDFGSRLYRIWSLMPQRCNNKNTKEYQFYGANGVTVCKEWRDYENFKSWAISNGYKDNLVIDKGILCDKLHISPKRYSPETCMWITSQENGTYAMKNIMQEVYQYDLDGNFIAKCASQKEACRQTDINQSNISAVIRGDRNKAGGHIWKSQQD